MQTINLNINKKIFNKTYFPYLNLETRLQIFFGGSSSGKSYFLAQRCVLDVLRGRNYLICRQVAGTVKKSVFNEITKAISNFKLTKYFKINKSEFTITCVLNNKQIIFVGLDDVEKIKSVTPVNGVITDIWVEEATESEYKSIKQLQKRLRGKSKFKKRLVLSFNPILKSHWIYQEYFKLWNDDDKIYKDDDISILKTTYKDNDFLTDDDIYNLENEEDKYYYNVYTLGNWGILGAVIFKNWEVQDLSDIKHTFDRLKNGLDFGFSQDPAALARTHYDKKRKTIYIFDELYERELTNDVLAREVKKKIGYEYVVCDSSEPKSIKELKQHGVNALGAKKGKDSINHGIQWLQQQTVIIDKSCTNSINEFGQYKWKEDKDGNVLRVPVDKNNHLIDGIRYAYEDESKTQAKFINVKGVR